MFYMKRRPVAGESRNDRYGVGCRGRFILREFQRRAGKRGKFNAQPGAMPRLALDADHAAVLLHDSIDNREAEASAYADRLGRKKWIENSGHDFSGNTGTIVGNFHSNAISGKTAGADMDAGMLASLLPPLLDSRVGVPDPI